MHFLYDRRVLLVIAAGVSGGADKIPDGLTGDQIRAQKQVDTRPRHREEHDDQNPHQIGGEDNIQHDHDAEQPEQSVNPDEMLVENADQAREKDGFHEQHENHKRRAIGQDFEKFHIFRPFHPFMSF